MKKIIIVFFIFSFISTNAFCATRQEIQTALDLIRYANIAQDLFNETAKIARGEVQKTTGSLTAQTKEDMTVEDIKQGVSINMQNINTYTSIIRKYLGTQEKRTMAINGLTALGVSLTDIEKDITDFESKRNTVLGTISMARDAVELKIVGDDIDATISNLNLLRNR